ncbi:MAG: sulfatase-like hydrolase/transferase [Acidobacteria bacterium]|nr:sulfatase-like hydrolase/transferase [Acidobacteriota bacterium]
MINRRDFLRIGAASLTAAACSSPQPETAARPNVVFILTDDQRWDALSAAGHPFLKTPNLDRIANEGVRFANAFVTTSLCSPSRASFLSGRYAHSHGVLNNFTEYPVDLPSFPVALHDAGYETAYIGKWHMGEDNDEKRPGFDYWISHKGQGTYWDTTFNVNGERREVPGYYTNVVTDFAVDWLSQPHDKPFLLCLGHKAPHGVWIPDKPYEHAFDDIPATEPETARLLDPLPQWVEDRIATWHGIDGNLYGLEDFGKFIRNYYATILSVDDSVGRVYEALAKAGRLDDTLIIFAGDNGFLLGEHASIDKRTMWEESIRVPLLARYPPLIAQPRVIEQQVLNIDVAPSVVDICGLPPLPGAQGHSFKRLVSTGEDPDWRKSWLYEYNFETQFPYTPNVRGVRTDDWKYVHYPNGPGRPETHKAELYHLAVDPLEKNNLIDDPGSQSKLEELKAELDRLLKETGDTGADMPVDAVLRMEPPDKAIR